MKLDLISGREKENIPTDPLNRSKKISCSYPKILKQEEGKAKFTSNLFKETENYPSMNVEINGKSGKNTNSTTGRELRCASSIRTQGHSAKPSCEKSGENKLKTSIPVPR